MQGLSNNEIIENKYTTNSAYQKKNPIVKSFVHFNCSWTL